MNNEDYKNRFHDHQSTDGVDSEALWDDISSELDSIEIEGSDSNGGYWKFGWTIVSVLTLGFIGYTLYSGQVSTHETNHHTSMTTTDKSSHSTLQDDKTIVERIKQEKFVYDDNHRILQNREAIDKKTNPAFVKNNTSSKAQISDVRHSNEINKNNESKANVKEDNPSNLTSSERALNSETKSNSRDEGKTVEDIRSVSMDSETFEGKALEGNNHIGESSKISEFYSDEIKVGKDEKAKSQAKDESDLDVSDNADLTSNGTVVKDEVATTKDKESATEKIKSTEISTNSESVVVSALQEERRQISSLRLKGVPMMKKPIVIFNKNKRKIQAIDYPSLGNSMPLELSLLVGGNTFFTIYSHNKSLPNLSQELQKAFVNNYGFSSSMKVTYLMPKGLSIGTGVDYSMYRSKFEITRERDVSVYIGEQLTTFDLDSLTGDSSNLVFQEIYADGIEIRRVRHNNKSVIWSIPLEIGWRTNKPKTNYGCKIGGTFNLVQSQNGKSLDREGTIVEYGDNSSNGAVLNKTFLGFQISPFVDRRISDKLKLRVVPTYKFQNLGKAPFHSLSLKRTNLSLKIGLVYRL